MALPNTYVQVYGQFPEFFAKIQEGQAPDKFTQQHLKDIGFASSTFRAIIPLLKTIGFLSDEGVPTSRYHAFRNRAEAPVVMAEALREAYSDLFVINDPPTERDKALIEGKFKSVHNATDRTAELMYRTFLGLSKLANYQSKRPSGKPPESPTEGPPDAAGIPQAPSIPQTPAGITPSLHYNIQIHLPATKDLEVYNAIFKSLKEHLLG